MMAIEMKLNKMVDINGLVAKAIVRGVELSKDQFVTTPDGTKVNAEDLKQQRFLIKEGFNR